MFDLSAFFTLPSGLQNAGQTPTMLGNDAKQIKPGEAALPSQDFMNLFIKNALNTLEQQKQTSSDTVIKSSNENDLLQSDNPALTPSDAISLLKTLAVNQDVAEQVSEDSVIFDMSLIQEIEHTLQLNAKAFRDIIHSIKIEQKEIADIEKEFEAFSVNDAFDLLQDAQSGDENGIYDAAGLIEALLAKHKSLAARANTGALNLTPEQLTQAIAKAEEFLASAKKTNPSNAKSKTLDNLPGANIQNNAAESATQALNDLLQSLSVIVQPVQSAQTSKTSSVQSTPEAPVTFVETVVMVMHALTLRSTAKGKPVQTMASSTEQTRAAAGKIISLEADNSGDTTKSINVKSISPKQAQEIIKTMTFSAASPSFADSSLQTSDASFQNYMDDLPPLLKIETSPLTQSITHSSVRAGASHPAVQMVTVTIQKHASNGTPKNITLQLDPPELGRVEVKMHFDKTSKMKTLMVVEKPETLALLQRDAQSLERAMSDMGIESDGAMEFSLADDGHFDQDGRHDGSRNQAEGKTGTKDASMDTQIIETQMDWSVDPHTGHVHYSIWV